LLIMAVAVMDVDEDGTVLGSGELNFHAIMQLFTDDEEEHQRNIEALVTYGEILQDIHVQSMKRRLADDTVQGSYR